MLIKSCPHHTSLISHVTFTLFYIYVYIYTLFVLTVIGHFETRQDIR